jgi:hypothetical protein
MCYTLNCYMNDRDREVIKLKERKTENESCNQILYKRR